MAEEEEIQSQQTSRYNEAINQLMRINNMWQQCSDYSSNGQLVKWKWKLDAMWRELSSSAKKMDKKIKKDEDKWCNRKLTYDKKIIEAKTREQLYSALNDKEEFLRWLQDESGKGSAWGDDDDFSLL